MTVCPGQDRQFWQPEDIYDIPCPHCMELIEFWKDDSSRTCPKCKKLVLNPKIDRGCMKWCKYALECAKQINSSLRDDKD